MMWKPVNHDIGRRLPSWLTSDEWKHAALSSRFRNANGTGVFGQVDDGRLWIRLNGNQISGALLVSRQGVVLPSFPADELDLSDREFFGKVMGPRRERIFSIIGLHEPVLAIEACMDRPVPDAQDYRMLVLDNPVESREEHHGVALRQVGPVDGESLWPLELAYQSEEVIRPGHHLNIRANQRHFSSQLKTQLVYAAYIDGKPVAKAGTNARGYLYDQLGGVYVLPGLRRRGLGRAVVLELLGAISRMRRKACLFVKKENIAACRLYLGLGFLDRGRFRISYWM